LRAQGGGDAGAGLASRVVIETDVRDVIETDSELGGSDWGGDGWGDDDSGSGWGWSEGPSDEDDASPYRRSRFVRAVALVTAVAVVTGSIGTWVAILVVGSPKPSYSVTSVHLSVPASEQRHATADPIATVTFDVANDSAVTATASCRALIGTSQGTVGSAVVVTKAMPVGSTAAVTMSVPLSASALAGNGAASVQVRCVPATTRSQSD
jgi:hypothetical protein